LKTVEINSKGRQWIVTKHRGKIIKRPAGVSYKLYEALKKISVELRGSWIELENVKKCKVEKAVKYLGGLWKIVELRGRIYVKCLEEE